MITFFISLALLVIGYFTYGKLTEKILKPTDMLTPAYTRPDGIDYVAMPTWKVFLIQLLNIAGTGPIFGALMGAVFGPVVFLWIVFGCILGGSVHDFCTGMISIRNNGASISEIVGKYLGKGMKIIMIFFSIILLVLVGTVFVASPAALIAMLTPEKLNTRFWVIIILLYYILATLLPIDKLIGKLYPLFGITLIMMVLLIGGGIIIKGYEIPELTLANLHPEGKPVWPYMFVTVACGAVSGFHATQSPMMARCIKTERDGRKVFYLAMITEGVIALIWAAAGVAFYGSTGALNTALKGMGQSGVVYDISTKLLGTFGGIMAIIGVVACPITSGDTAFRSARLTIADALHLDQRKLWKRLLISIPLLVVGAVLTTIDFDIIWRYFSWANQTLAMIALWAAAVYLKKNYGRLKSLIAVFPALFMSGVCSTYILMADEGLKLSTKIAYPLGGVFVVLCGVLFVVLCFIKKEKADEPLNGALTLTENLDSTSNINGDNKNPEDNTDENIMTLELKVEDSDVDTNAMKKEDIDKYNNE